MIEFAGTLTLALGAIIVLTLLLAGAVIAGGMLCNQILLWRGDFWYAVLLGVMKRPDRLARRRAIDELYCKAIDECERKKR